MASVLFKFLRILHLVRRYIGRTTGRWAALFIGFLSRKLSEWLRTWPGSSRPAESSFPCNGHSSAWDGPVVLRGRVTVVAASNVPPSASQSLQEPQNTTFIHGKKQKTTSVALGIQGPSSESLPTIDLPQVTEEPAAIGSPAYSSINSSMEHIETASQRAIMASSLPLPERNLPKHRFLQQIISEDVPRYTRNITIPRDSERRLYIVDALTVTFPYFSESNRPGQASRKQDCSPWQSATHPDGALYFYDSERRLFTDTDMHDQALKEEMEDFYLALQKILNDGRLTIPSQNYDLVLDITVAKDSDKIQWAYYYACHENRCLFWLEPFDGSHMISGLVGVDSPAHVKHRLEGLYWFHWSLYPVVFVGRCLLPQVYDELIGMLAHGCIDVMTSMTSTLPYDHEQMQKMISLVEKAKDTKSGEEYYTAGASRLLSLFANWKFEHFHGQRHARLDWDNTVYDNPKRERSALISLLSPLLFLAPEVHLREMEMMWNDDTIIERVWRSFMTKLLNEWNDLILWSTVMLAVSVSFLTIPGVILYSFNNNDNLHHAVILTSSSQIAATLSVEASVGSVIIGLLLVRRNRTKQRTSPSDARGYLITDYREAEIVSLERMAIVFSLPWALLMWSMVTFSLALLLFCFVISNNWTRVVVALTSASVVALTLVCIRSTWESPRTDGKVWRDGFWPSIIRVLRYGLISYGRHSVECLSSFVIRVVESLRNHLSTPATDDPSRIGPSSTGPQGGGSSGGV